VTDPDRIVLFDDISSVLFLVKSDTEHVALILTVLAALGVPIVHFFFFVVVVFAFALIRIYKVWILAVSGINSPRVLGRVTPAIRSVDPAAHGICLCGKFKRVDSDGTFA